MKPEEHDELWHLLGKVRTTRVSPFFARNVLRAIREQSDSREKEAGFWSWVRRRWSLAACGAAFAVVLCAVALQQGNRPDPVIVLAGKVSASPDFQVITHLDELLESEQNSVWLDTAPY